MFAVMYTRAFLAVGVLTFFSAGAMEPKKYYAPEQLRAIRQGKLPAATVATLQRLSLYREGASNQPLQKCGEGLHDVRISTIKNLYMNLDISPLKKHAACLPTINNIRELIALLENPSCGNNDKKAGDSLYSVINKGIEKLCKDITCPPAFDTTVHEIGRLLHAALTEKHEKNVWNSRVFLPVVASRVRGQSLPKDKAGTSDPFEPGKDDNYYKLLCEEENK